MPLTPKQQRFVEEYLVDLNATQAAIRAKYSIKTARQVGSENLSKPVIAAAIAEAMKKREQRTNLTADRVLKELERIAFSDPRRFYDADGNLKDPQDWDDDTAAAVASLEVEEEIEKNGHRHITTRLKKIKRWDKNAALLQAMRHLGLLKDRIEHSGPGGGPIRYAEMSDAELDAEIKRLSGI